MAEVILYAQNFEEEVMHSDRPVLVDFWAPWCGPCKMLAPVLSEIAAEHPEIKVCKVNVDENMELAEQYRVTSIPLLSYFRDGRVVDSMRGLQPKSAILEMLNE
ncbi:MAG: thioredoxin [Lachnospiraceae bacterium]|nr:thioredoxin [Lachnospiraceae bacterium]